jgi:hypothetical protein
VRDFRSLAGVDKTSCGVDHGGDEVRTGAGRHRVGRVDDNVDADGRARRAGASVKVDTAGARDLYDFVSLFLRDSGGVCSGGTGGAGDCDLHAVAVPFSDRKVSGSTGRFRFGNPSTTSRYDSATRSSIS